MEIERKYLVNEIPEDSAKHAHYRISQGYIISSVEAEVRVRMKESHFTQSFKRGAGIAREEVEIELSEAQFNTLWPLTRGRRVEKIRYNMPYQSQMIELDIYGGDLQGLVIAEVEFDSKEESESFEPPTWFGREVTFDERYKNKNLAVHGMPSGRKL
jgi:CYTH domain-containing protein